MYKLQLSDARQELGLVKASGVTPSSPDFADYLNRSTRMLMRRGPWTDTEWVISLCVSGCIIAWPRWVGAIKGIRFGRGKPGQLFNNNYSFVGPHHRGSGFHCDTVVEDANMGPTANEVSGTTGKFIRYYVVKNSDVGKTITLVGSQYGAQPLQEQVSGAWKNGVTLTAAAPYAQTSQLVTGIDAITRQATDGMAYLYEVDLISNTLRDLASFEPNETNPRIRRSHIINRPSWGSQPDANGICWTTVEALIDLEFIPVRNDRDFLMIDNVDALIFMVTALKRQEASDTAGAEAAIIQAIRELNFELRDNNANEQIPVRVMSVIGRRIKNLY